MPKTAIKHLAKRAKVSVERAEHLWNKAASIVKSEYDYTEDDAAFWGLRMNITKRMLGLSESITFSQFIREQVQPPNTSYEDLKNLIKKDCSQFLSAATKPLYRGMKASDFTNTSIKLYFNIGTNIYH